MSFTGSLIVVLVDDGSDESNFPDAGWMNDQRELMAHPIHLISTQLNNGIAHALNKGLQYILTEISAKYIARLDCGDINHPDRFVKQFTFMEEHPNVGLLGSWAQIVGNEKIQYAIRTPVTAVGITRRMFINNCFVHPAVIFRTSCANEMGFYPIDYPAAEDFGYFFRFVRRYETANLPEVLVTVPMAEHNISMKHRNSQLKSRLRIICDNFEWNIYCLWGLLRTVILLAIPHRTVENFKQIAFNDHPPHH